MYQESIEKKKPEIEKSLDHFQLELQKLRTGRASTALVEDLLVDYYGAKSPLKQLASVTIPESRTIAISPWDKGALPAIEKAIRESELNLNPNNDGQLIRITVPALNEERRKDLARVLNQKAEEVRIAIRKHREEVWEEIQSFAKEGRIGEDEKFKGKDSLQELVDEYNRKIEDIRKVKEKEILTI